MKAQKSTYKELTEGMPFQLNTHDEQGLMGVRSGSTSMHMS